MVERYNEIAQIILKFCDDKLDEEYKSLCFQALAALSRKRPSPLISGKAPSLASAIIYAIGRMNFIFDRGQKIHLTAGDISDWFQLSKGTISTKAKDISRILHLYYFNPVYSLQSNRDKAPYFFYT
ncbi:MAG: DUF6398 domain-containing protein [Deltaproteobacteria bacterium]|jgi:hypothetical protein|nr:DUF6398 domain-containing protein [Deltaproteobacteria bacterium]